METEKEQKADFLNSLDFDGCMALGLPVKLKYAKQWFDVDLELDQTKAKGFDALMQSLGRPDINYRSLMDPVNEAHIMEYEIPAGCADALRYLHEHSQDFVVVTSRNDHDYPYAVQFIEERFAGLIANIHHTRDKPKSDLVERLRPRTHIDDDLFKMEPLEHLPVELMYFRQPENAHQPNVKAGRVLEITSWKQYQFYCQQLQRLHNAICRADGIPNISENVPQIYEANRRMTTQERALLMGDDLKTR